MQQASKEILCYAGPAKPGESGTRQQIGRFLVAVAGMVAGLGIIWVLPWVAWTYYRYLPRWLGIVLYFMPQLVIGHRHAWTFTIALWCAITFTYASFARRLTCRTVFMLVPVVIVAGTVVVDFLLAIAGYGVSLDGP